MLRKYVKNSLILILFTVLLVMGYDAHSVSAQESDMTYSIDNAEDWKNLSKVTEKAKYILNADIDVGDYTLIIDKTAYITIDFNGHTVTGNGNCNSYNKIKKMIVNNGTFAIMDSSDKKDGAFVI